MGNLNCKQCNCAQFFEKKVELDLKNPKPSHQDQSKSLSNVKSSKSNQNQFPKLSNEQLRPYIRRLEALWLGYTARNLVIHMKRQTKPNHDYFSKSEIHETLSKKVGISEFRQKKKPFQYPSGAVYSGQWLGGFRDGFGTMEWPDGARYQGNWSYSKPCGFGTFTHVDGDVYEGEWKICFVSPKDTFGTGSNLERWKDMVSDGFRKSYLVWLWIKQEIFKTEAPKKPRKRIEINKSVRVEKGAREKFSIQIEEETQSTSVSKSSVKQSLNLRSSQVSAGFREEKNSWNHEKSRGKNRNNERKKSSSEESSKKKSSSSESSSKGSRQQAKVRTVGESFQTKGRINQNFHRADAKKEHQRVFPPKITESKLHTRKDSEQIRPLDPVPVRESKESIKFVMNSSHSHKSSSSESSNHPQVQSRDLKLKVSPKFSLASKSVIMTETISKPSKIEKEDNLMIKRNPVIRYKKIHGRGSDHTSTDQNYEGDSVHTKDFPHISKTNSISSHKSSGFLQKSHPETIPIIQKSKNPEKNSKSSSSSSSSSSKSKSSSIDQWAQIKTRISLSETSLLELKKTISDILVPKNVSGSHKFSQKKFKDGGMYIGELKNDKKDGKGKMIFSGGDIYEGEWMDDKQHGRGKMIWANGATYIGFFDNDQKSGIGEYVWSDGASYLGEWRDNKFYGYGRYRWTDGRIYNGQWDNGKRNGIGILVDKNGHKYEGEFENDKLHGKGVLSKSNGDVTKGVWVNGKLQ